MPSCKSACWRQRDTRFDRPQMNRWMMRWKMKHKTNLTLNIKYTTTFKTLTLKYTTFGYTPTKVLGYLANTISFIYLMGQVWVYIKIISWRWVRGGGRVFEKFTSTGSNYVYQVDTQWGFGEKFLVPAPHWKKPLIPGLVWNVPSIFQECPHHYPRILNLKCTLK